MPKSQSKGTISPPGPTDRDMLVDYSSAIQTSFHELFQAAHDHLVLKAAPSKITGKSQIISIVDDGTNVYLVVRTTRGWFKSANFTALP
jgi:hypothetical protein